MDTDNNKQFDLKPVRVGSTEIDKRTQEPVTEEVEIDQDLEVVEPSPVTYYAGESIDDTVPTDVQSELVETMIESDLKFVGRVFTVELDKVLLSDGRHSRREIVRHPGGSCIVALDLYGNIYMVRQYRLALGRITLELPAGLGEPDETPLDCAVRELHEETGLVAEDWRRLASIHTSPGYSDEVSHIFLAEGLTMGNSNPDDGEFVTVEKLPLTEAVEMVLNGSISDAKSCVGILLAAKLA